MTPEIYKISLLIIACFLTYFSVYLLFGRIPLKLHHSAYHSSRRYMAAGFFTVALAIFVFHITDMGSMPPSVRIALNVSCYFVASKFIAISFLLLIGRKKLLQTIQSKIWLATLVAFPVAAWATLLIPNEAIIHVVQSVMAVALFVSILLDVLFFFKQYRQAVKQGDYYYAEGIGVHISWMINSVYAIVSVGLLSALMGFISHCAPQWILFIYMACFVAVCMYIFGEMLNFTNIFSDIVEKSINVEPISEGDIRKTNLSVEVSKQIEDHIAAWIEAKEFCKGGVSIITMANEMGTNRLYLSTFINTNYKCSFRQWVSRLRVGEAKRLIKSDPSVTITAIGEQVGFVSLTSFTHSFKNIEGISPKEWADANVNVVSEPKL